MGKDAEIVRDQKRYRPDKSEVRRLWCDNAKIIRLTGFQASYSIDEGLRETIEWFKKDQNLFKYKTGVYNV